LTTAEELMKCLEHLSHYTNARDIQNGDPTSVLANKLRVEILGKSAAYSPPPSPQLFDVSNANNLPLEPLCCADEFPMVFSGEWIVVRITNCSSVPLNISVLDLESTWEITQIYPGTGTDFENLDPGKSTDLPLRMTIPETLRHGEDDIIDIIKVFATLEPTSFLWLELPELSQTRLRESSISTVVPEMFHPFEFMRQAAAIGGPSGRGSREASSYMEWTTEQVIIRTRMYNPLV
jgi:hypothetical protein